MKMVIALTLTSLFTFAAGKAMDLPLSFVQAAQQGNEPRIDEFFAGDPDKISYANGLKALEQIIKGGHVLIIPKLLTFLSRFDFEISETNGTDDAFSQEVTDIAVTCACSYENEETAISMLNAIFNYPSLPKATVAGSYAAVEAAIKLRHANIITILFQYNKLRIFPYSVITLACKYNYPDPSISLLKSMRDKKIMQKFAYQTMCTAAEDKKIEYLNALLAEPEITQCLSIEQQSSIGEFIGTNHKKLYPEKTIIKQAPPHKKGCCTVL